MLEADSAPIEVFISYSHKDERLRERLGVQLSLLKRQGTIDTWHDRLISAGQEWAEAIDEHLNSATIILLLVSPDFLASDYCYKREVELAMQRHDAGDARVIPVILRPVLWEGAPFARLQALPKNGRPIRKWPDKDEAFLDVARGIQKAVEEVRTTQASAPPVPGARTQRLPPIWNVPPARIPQFTGRDDLLEQLHQKLSQGPVALTAKAGFGKTQLALEYAYRHAHDFDLVWWLRAEEPATLREDYAALAQPLDLEEAQGRELEVVTYAVRRELARREGWLLVFDNAAEPKDVLPLLPGGNGRILITSRQQDWPVAVATSIGVPTLSRAASVGLLLGGTGQQDRRAADALAQELGDLPLALGQAAAYVQATNVSLADYLQHFRGRRAAA